MIHTCTIQARMRVQRLDYSDGVGDAVIGQTVTGAESGATAVVAGVGEAYLRVRGLSKPFVADEAVSTPTWSGTLVSQADYANQSGEPAWYWADSETGVRCRFYVRDGQGRRRHDTGDIEDPTLRCMLPPTATVGEIGYRIATTEAGFAGTYAVKRLVPRSNARGLDHYEADLEEAI